MGISTVVTLPRSADTGGHALLRIYWMVIGAALIALFALAIVRDDHTIVSGPSLALWLVGGSMVLARWVDITRYGGLTSEGAPATMADLRRYTARVLGVTSAVWIAALVLR